MFHLIEAFSIALRMIVSGDAVVFSIALRTLLIASASTLAATLLFVPLGCLIHFNSFRGKRLARGFIQTMYSVPTVFVGMLVFLMVSRAGPLGGMGILFSPWAIILGEIILIFPIITGLTLSALQGTGKGLEDTAIALGARRRTMVLKVLTEARYTMLTSVLMGFGRAVSEVGVAIMVGGNIAGHTRTLTTAIALGVGKGETASSIALGLILLSLAMIVSIMVNLLQHGGNR
ncbi:MAG: ABC transporter permease [Candidatus Sabulitectum sp.]|nr:ABC transporter permease [Candidatus Sabulitectum sp.]